MDGRPRPGGQGYTLTDLDLAARLAEGDPDAAERLVREHYPTLFRFLRPLTGRREDAEDLTLQALQRGAKASAGTMAARLCEPGSTALPTVSFSAGGEGNGGT